MKHLMLIVLLFVVVFLFYFFWSYESDSGLLYKFNDPLVETVVDHFTVCCSCTHIYLLPLSPTTPPDNVLWYVYFPISRLWHQRILLPLFDLFIVWFRLSAVEICVSSPRCTRLRGTSGWVTLARGASPDSCGGDIEFLPTLSPSPIHPYLLVMWVTTPYLIFYWECLLTHTHTHTLEFML